MGTSVSLSTMLKNVYHELESNEQGQFAVIRSAEVSGKSEETNVPEKEAQQQQQQPPPPQQQRDETDSSFHTPDFNRQNTQVLYLDIKNGRCF